MDDESDPSEGRPPDDRTERTYDGSETDAEESEDGADTRGDGDESGISRRALLAGGGAVGAGALAVYASGIFDDQQQTQNKTNQALFSVMAEMQAGIRESPDHLAGTAADLVEQGDAQALYEFVRDDIETQPPSRDGNGQFATAVNGGPRGTLRSGIGTPRDKAELLATLLERAGYTATVRQYNREIAPDRTKEIYFDPSTLSFDPGFTDEQRKEWREKLDIETDNGQSGGSETPQPGGGGTAGEREPTVVDRNGEESSALAERVRSGFTESMTRQSAQFQWDQGGNAVPVVEFSQRAGSEAGTTGTPTDDGTATATATEDGPDASDPSPGSGLQYADLFHADESFGSLSDDGSLGDAVDPDTQTVTVTLEAATIDAPSDRFELVSGTWDATELAGRQIQVETLPGTNPFDVPELRYTDVRKFVPTLGVQDPHGEQAELSELSVVVDTVTIVGDRYAVEDDGTVKRNDEVLVETSESGDGTAPPPIPDTVDTVENLNLKPNAGGYPTIKLKMNPRDGNGDIVEGLPGRAFDVTEEGDPVVTTIESNRDEPKIDVYYDTSGSMNDHGFFEKAQENFRESMKSDIQAVKPDATIAFEEVDSDSWENMASAAAASDADLFIYFSDGDGYSGSPSPEQETAISSGPPSIMLSITGDSYDVAERMANLTGGTHISSNDPQALRDALSDEVDALDEEIKSYTLTYRTPNKGEAGETRTVTVALNNTDVSEQITYEIPADSFDPRAKRGLCGLYLTVETETDGRNVGSTTSRRTLAGWDPETDSDRPPNWADRNEVFSALFGSTVLSFESAGVRPSIFFDDILTGKLSLEELYTHSEEEELEKFRQKLQEDGVRVASSHPYEFQQPLPDRVTENTVTYGTGVRTVLYQRLTLFGEARSTQSYDVLSTSSIRTVTRSGDRTRAFDLTMDRTARYAIFERQYETSTAGILAGRTLERDSRARENWSDETREQFDTALDRRSASGDDYRIATPDIDTAAHWTIDTETGSMLGVLPDGSGGSEQVERIKEDLRRIKQVTYAMGLLVDAAPASAGAGALGVVVAYQRLLARLYALASIAIATMDASGIREDAAKLIANWICNLVVGLGFESVPIVGTLLTLNDIDGATDGSTVGCSAVTGSPL